MDPIAEARRQWIAHGWESPAGGMALVTTLTRVHQLLTDRIDAVLRPLDLTFARYEVLRLLAFTRSGSMPMARLGSLLQVHPTSVSSAVARLEKQGFVTRLRSEDDARVVLATLTDAGRSVVERATVGLNAEVFGLPELTDADSVAVTTLLTNLRASLGDATS